MKLRIVMCLAATVAFGGWIAGCDNKPTDNETTAADAPNAQSPGIPAGVFVNPAPAGAVGVHELKQDKASGGDVVVRGRIGGRARPFVEGAAVFVLTDSALKSCDQRHGDNCKTPWDYCCETPESIAANTATIQIVDADGKPIRVSAEGRHGLKPLAEIVIRGEIARRSEDGNLVINAKEIAVVG